MTHDRAQQHRRFCAQGEGSPQPAQAAGDSGDRDVQEVLCSDGAQEYTSH